MNINNSTVFLLSKSGLLIDDSASGHTLIAAGNPVSEIINDPFLDSSHAVYLNGEADNLHTGLSADFNFSGSDFTIETWAMPIEFNVQYPHLVTLVNNNDSIEIRCCIESESKKLMFIIYHSGSYVVRFFGNTLIKLHKLVHIAIVKNSDVHSIYVDGKLDGQFTIAHTIPSESLFLSVGDIGIAVGYKFKGFLYRTRISKTAKYAGNSFDLPLFDEGIATYNVQVDLQETIYAVNFAVRAYAVETGKMLVNTVVQAGISTIKLPAAAVYLSVAPYQGKQWQKSTLYNVGDLVFTSNTTDMPFFYKRLVSGVSSISEPIFGSIIGSLYDDNSIVGAWECVSGLSQPKIHGPLIPS